MSMGLCGTCIIEVEDASSSEDEPVDGEYALGHSTTSRFFSVNRLDN
jgi:ferredoxin